MSQIGDVFIESFNARRRDELLDGVILDSRNEAKIAGSETGPVIGTDHIGPEFETIED